MKRRSLLAVLATVLALALVVTTVLIVAKGCSGSDDPPTPTPSASPTAFPSGEAASPSPGASPSETATPTPEGPTPTPPGGVPSGMLKTAEAFLYDPATDPNATATSQELFDQLDFAKRAFRPVYQPKLTLFASTQNAKPASLPALSTADPAGAAFLLAVGDATASRYTNVPFQAIVPDTGSQVVWFAIDLDVSNAAKLILQIGNAPFPGGPGDGKDPPGLVASDELDPGTREFSLDFGMIRALEKYQTAPSYLTPIASPWSWFDAAKARTRQRVYYVRVFPVDAAGRSIGDTGAGLPILAGRPLQQPPAGRYLATRFGMLSANRSGVPSFMENPTVFLDLDLVILSSLSDDANKRYHFRPTAYPDTAHTLVVQVATADFTEAAANWEKPSGLVYERRLRKGEPEFDKLPNANQSVGIDFSGFALTDAQVGTKQMLYYVRTVALSTGTEPGTVTAAFSRTVKVQYGRPASTEPIFMPQVALDAGLPVIESISYTPVKWEWADWMYHYVVIRQPTYREVFGIGTDDPLPAYSVGRQLDFTPDYTQEESWWEEAWNAITSFFTDLASFLADVVDWVSSTYNNLKSDLIDFVAKNFPIESLRDELKQALTALADYGLATIGLPPSLPTFDEITSLGAEYLATVALEQAGVPAPDLAAKGLDQVKGAIGDSLDASNDGASPNPMGWDFIQQDPKAMYRPAYLLITVYNPTDKVSPPGWISVDTDLYVASRPTGPDEQSFYSKFGNSSHYTLFKPVRAVQVPSLRPHQRLDIPIFLEEYINVPFYNGGPTITRADFRTLYYGFGAHEFTVAIRHELPLPSEFAKNQGMAPNAVYTYKSTGDVKAFTNDPALAFSQKWP